MQLQFLGSGSAFTPISENYHSNVIVKSLSGQRLLIDCGTDARHAMAALNLDYKDIDAVYISHLHADHAGGLEWLAFSRKFNSSTNPPKLFIHSDLRDRLWDHLLSAGLQSLEGEQPATLDTFFDVQPLNNDKHFTWEAIDFELIAVKHVYNGKTLTPSFGLMINHDQHRILFTSDTQFTPDLLMPYYQQSDMIFHDCETAQTQSGVHAHFDDLVTLDPTIKEKMWLYHYSTGTLPDAQANGFLGFVEKGQCFNYL